MTYREAYQLGVELLQQNQIGEAILDARLLLEAICKTSHNDLILNGDKEITEEVNIKYLEWITERSDKTPLQYITKSQEFMGLDFIVNSNVLIPRQDTEILVEEAMIHTSDGMRILDICTGSGCILLSLMKYKNNCTGLGVDISKRALEVARENGEKLKIEATFLESDILEKVEGKFDIVVSNPPYIKTAIIETLSDEVKGHEPMLALDGKEDGVYFYKKIIEQVKSYMNKGAMLLFEIGYDQGKEVEILMKTAGFTNIVVIRDLSGLDRVVKGIY